MTDGDPRHRLHRLALAEPAHPPADAPRDDNGDPVFAED